MLRLRQQDHAQAGHRLLLVRATAEIVAHRVQIQMNWANRIDDLITSIERIATALERIATAVEVDVYDRPEDEPETQVYGE